MQLLIVKLGDVLSKGGMRLNELFRGSLENKSSGLIAI